jgi:hypothetical protein
MGTRTVLLKVSLIGFVLSSLFFIFCILMAATARGEELRAKLDCRKGVCVPVAAGNVDMKKVRALAARAAQLKRAINEAQGRDQQRLERFVDDVLRLKDEVAELKRAYGPLNSGLKPLEYRAAEAAKKLKKLEEGVRKLEDAVSDIIVAADIDREMLKVALKRPTLNLELSTLGYFTAPYGVGASSLVSLVLPMGSEGQWAARASFGAGLSPSMGFSWMATGSLVRTWVDKVRVKYAVGPAVLFITDEGDLLERRGWLAGVGAEFRLSYGHWFLLVTPFIGVTPRMETVGSDNPTNSITISGGTGAPCVQTPCGCYDAAGQRVSGPSFQTNSPPPTTEKALGVAGGALVSVGASLF